MGGPVSHGRGGAGNIYTSKAQAATPQDLVTPTIKQEVYTTGRGGSGNMMHNDPERPELARESQDVQAPPIRVQEAPHHTGRGGAANAYIPSPEEEKKAREDEEHLRRVVTARSTREPRDIEEGNAKSERGRSSPAS
ncbi:hypothetical protein BJX99DRAFT_258108 [Aspergillus californicus]